MLERLRRYRPDGVTVLVWGLIAVLAILSIYPTVTLLTGAFRDGSPFFGSAGWSLQGFADAYGSSESAAAIRNSVFLALCTAVLGTGFGFLFAWTATRTSVRFARLLTPIMVVTVALPSLFIALSWAVLANGEVGTINTAWRSLSGSHGTLVEVYGWPGLVGLSLIKPIAVAYLLFLGPCLSLSREVEEASVLTGTSVMRTLVKITVPLMAPTIIAVSVINLIIGLEAFDIPALIASPAGIPLLSTEVYRHIHEHIPANYPAASALSLGIAMVVLVLVAFRWRLVSKRSYATVTGKSKTKQRWDVGRRWSAILSTMILVYAVLALILPLVQLVVGSFQPLFGSFRRFDTSNYEKVFANSDAMSSIARSLVIGVGGGLLAMLFTVAVAYAVRHAGGKFSTRVLDMATWLPAALPGIVLGLALSWAYLLVPVLRPLYGTPGMLVIALMIAGMPLAARASEGALVSIHRELEESARVSGASRIRTVRDVLGPLITPSFLAGWLLTSLYVAGRLDVPVLLTTPGNRLAVVSVYELFSNGRTGEAAAVLCLLLLGFVLVAAAMAAMALVVRRVLTVKPQPSRTRNHPYAEPSAQHTGQHENLRHKEKIRG